MKITDKRYKGIEKDVPVFSISRTEQETTINVTRTDVEVYSSIPSDITRILEITDEVDVLSVNESGNINSIKAKLKHNQVSFRMGNKKVTN